MSDTPRTDACAMVWTVATPRDGREMVSADFARGLERENAKMRAAIDALLDHYRFRSSGEALVVLRVIEAAQRL